MATAVYGACTYGRCPHRAGPSGRCVEHERLRESERRNVDTRAWYHTDRWRALRRLVLIEEPYCRECEAERRHRVNNTDVDHRIPHRGDPRLFWDRTNLQGKCHGHHSQKTRRGE